MSVRAPRAIAAVALLLLGAAVGLLVGAPARGAEVFDEANPPETKITFGPEGPTFATRPTFGYESNDPEAYFECSLDSGSFEFCGPATYESLEGKRGRELADGPHTFAVRAVTAKGVADPTPAVAHFTVDTDPPTASILTRPRHFIRETRPTFAIKVEGEVNYWCRIFGEGVKIKVRSCDGPTSFTSPRPLAEGTYTFLLGAVDSARSETEDRVEFTVRTKPGPPPPPPDPYRGSTLYTGRGDGGRGVKSITFRLRGRKLIEAHAVVIEACVGAPWGTRKWRRYHRRTELNEASPQSPLRLDDSGKFHRGYFNPWQSGDDFEKVVGTVSPDLIVGRIALSSSENQGAGGESFTCHTGPFPGPMQELKFHARPKT